MKLRSTGRGRHYSPARGLVESALGLVYRKDWPARAWGRYPPATRVRNVRYVLPLERGDRPPLRIAFMSDLHVGPTTPWRTLEQAASHVRALRPDVLLLGGDYVFLDATPQKCQRLQGLVAAIDAPVKLGVWGNHDLWTDHLALQSALASAGVRMLQNECVTLPGPHDDIDIFGLDEPWTGTPDASGLPPGDRQTIDQQTIDRHCIVLGHSPDAYDFVRHAAPAVLVCGHTHGGQIALPGGRPLVVPGRRGLQWPHGEHTIDTTRVLVSRGLGGVEIPFRAWSPPDVLCIDIVHAPRGRPPTAGPGH